MPKSKRNKLVTLSHAKKKGREHKESIIQGVREALEQYGAVYVFEYETMRNSKLKELREELKDNSRFFLGSNKILQVALGRDAATELKEGLHQCSELLVGQRGLLLTDLSHSEVSKRLEETVQADFARSGSLATETVELKEGPLEQFSHDMEPFLRKQGLPVRLNKGTVELLGDFTVCQEGEPLTPEASTTLRLLGITMTEFRLHLVARWTKDGFEDYGSPIQAQKKKEFVNGFVESDDEG